MAGAGEDRVFLGGWIGGDVQNQIVGRVSNVNQTSTHRRDAARMRLQPLVDLRTGGGKTWTTSSTLVGCDFQNALYGAKLWDLGAFETAQVAWTRPSS